MSSKEISRRQVNDPNIGGGLRESLKKRIGQVVRWNFDGRLE
jgi:hypothetical protein